MELWDTSDVERRGGGHYAYFASVCRICFGIALSVCAKPLVGYYPLCCACFLLFGRNYTYQRSKAGFFGCGSFFGGVRTAALETLAENLSDGVIAPLFWYLLLGVPGMLAYKMVNTLDSMIGYRNERYLQFGCVAAHIDDMANYIPARLTAFLMVLCAGRPGLLRFVGKYGNRHASPNSGYPESALAGILNCRFGGPHVYFGEIVYKPFIGDKDRFIHTQDMHKAVDINRRAEILMVIVNIVCLYLVG